MLGFHLVLSGLGDPLVQMLSRESIKSPIITLILMQRVYVTLKQKIKVSINKTHRIAHSSLAEYWFQQLE
jgi:hypothetical protein